MSVPVIWYNGGWGLNFYGGLAYGPIPHRFKMQINTKIGHKKPVLNKTFFYSISTVANASVHPNINYPYFPFRSKQIHQIQSIASWW